MASLITGDTTAASFAIDDSCVASVHIDSAGVVSARPPVPTPNPKAKKGRGSGEAAASTGTRRSARLTAKPTQLELPQITDAEESDEDDNVDYDFR